MNLEGLTFVMISQKEWNDHKNTQREILQLLKKLNQPVPKNVLIKNITAQEFMDAIRIKRTKFDQLVAENKIKIIKKRRKIYVPVSEIDRYFEDNRIQ